MAKRDPAVTATLTVYCQPGARQTRLAGLHGGLPKIQLAAPPVDGAANEALLTWLAQRLNIPRSRIELVAGAASRIKRLRITGTDGETIRRALGLADPADGAAH